MSETSTSKGQLPSISSDLIQESIIELTRMSHSRSSSRGSSSKDESSKTMKYLPLSRDSLDRLSEELQSSSSKTLSPEKPENNQSSKLIITSAQDNDDTQAKLLRNDVSITLLYLSHWSIVHDVSNVTSSLFSFLPC